MKWRFWEESPLFSWISAPSGSPSVLTKIYSIINVSGGGLCIAAPPDQIEHQEYQIQIITPDHGSIEYSGHPVYQNDKSIGIKITFIEKDYLKTIYQMVESFQITEEFIKYIDESTVINDWLVDESGDDVSISFETEN